MVICRFSIKEICRFLIKENRIFLLRQFSRFESESRFLFNHLMYIINTTSTKHKINRLQISILINYFDYNKLIDAELISNKRLLNEVKKKKCILSCFGIIKIYN